MFAWLSAPKEDDQPLDSWAPERRQKLRTLDLVHGDAQAATLAWDGHQRELFAR